MHAHNGCANERARNWSARTVTRLDEVRDVEWCVACYSASAQGGDQQGRAQQHAVCARCRLGPANTAPPGGGTGEIT